MNCPLPSGGSGADCNARSSIPSLASARAAKRRVRNSGVRSEAVAEPAGTSRVDPSSVSEGVSGPEEHVCGFFCQDGCESGEAKHLRATGKAFFSADTQELSSELTPASGVASAASVSSPADAGNGDGEEKCGERCTHGNGTQRERGEHFLCWKGGVPPSHPKARRARCVALSARRSVTKKELWLLDLIPLWSPSEDRA